METNHPGAVLTGGTIPPHIAGAYPRLGCCGGPIVLVDDKTGELVGDRPIGRFEVGDRVRIRPSSRSAFAGEVGRVTALYHVDGPYWTVTVRPDGRALALPFASSHLELAEVGDRIIRAAQTAAHGIGCPARYEEGDCDLTDGCEGTEEYAREAERRADYYHRGAV